MKRSYSLLIILALALAGCSRQPNFESFPKIDAHAHLETSDVSFVEVLKENNFLLMSLVTRSVSQPLIEEEFNYAKELYEGHPEAVAFDSTFFLEGFGEPGWVEYTFEWL
jgi:hypothetical protein